jgi:hypothetical protein
MTLTGLSVGLISGIAMGGGFVVREEAGEEWIPQIDGATGDKSVRIVRPLRDMGMKECAAWVWWNGLDIVGKEIIVGSRQGIGELTRGRSHLNRASSLKLIVHGHRIYCRIGEGLSLHRLDYFSDMCEVDSKRCS